MRLGAGAKACIRGKMTSKLQLARESKKSQRMKKYKMGHKLVAKMKKCKTEKRKTDYKIVTKMGKCKNSPRKTSILGHFAIILPILRRYGFWVCKNVPFLTPKTP